MSYFDTHECCLACIDDEKGAPNYAQAKAAEAAACARGDYNFPGIGLQPEDRAYLVQRRAQRKERTQAA